MENIKEKFLSARSSGNTEWILKSAINNSNCIIVSKNKDYSRDLEFTFKTLLKKSIWYKRFFWFLFGRKYPKFKTIDSNLAGLNCPIIFDNSALI